MTASPSKRLPDGDPAEALAQVGEVAGDGDEAHDLARGGDVEPGLARVAVHAPAETRDDVAQRAVVHVHAAPPRDRERVEAELVAVQQVGVDERREEVVRRRDRVEVAREVEVQVLHRDDLRIAAARGAALDAEHRAERRLAEREDRPAADRAEALGQRHGGRRLPLARGGRRDRGDVDDLRVGPVGEPVEDREVDLRLVPAVLLELVGLDARLGSDVCDRAERCRLGDLEAREHSEVLLVRRRARSLRGRAVHQWLTAAAASSETSVSVCEALQPERLDQVGRPAARDQLGERDPDDRRRLEPVGPPPAVDEEAVDLGDAHDRAVVRAHVAEARPVAEDPGRVQLREQLEHVARRVLDEREGALVRVRRVRLDLGADQELAAVGLRDVDVHLRRDDDLVEERLHGLGDERLQDRGRDRQPEPRELRDRARPAGRRAQDDVAGDVALRRPDAVAAAVANVEAGDLDALVDVDAGAPDLLREAPDDGVVADDPARRVVESAEDRPGDVVADVDLGAEPLHLVPVDHAARDAEQLVHLGALVLDDERAVGVREREVPVLREHEVEVELGGELLVERDALAVERRALGRPVVRADDRRVPAGRPGADVALLEDRDVRDPVVPREVVRRREAVRAAADDHDVVVAPERVRAPEHALPEEDVLHGASSRGRASTPTSPPPSAVAQSRATSAT